MSTNHARIHWRARERLRRRALARDNWRCSRCESPLDLECHHVKALADGGDPLDLANVRTLCASCHIDSHRSVRDPERAEWMRALREGL